MPDNIWYHDYQIVKVNPPIEIEDDMIVDLGDIAEFKKFVKTVSQGRLNDLVFHGPPTPAGQEPCGFYRGWFYVVKSRVNQRDLFNN